jgi:hypothetical protein
MANTYPLCLTLRNEEEFKMTQRTFFLGLILIITASVGMAGTITNGVWAPTGCGTETVAPVVEQSSVDAYNKSVKAINEWQQKTNAYNICLINEANADNALIVKTAQEEQRRFQAAIQKIKTDTDAAKTKLDRK